MLIKYRRHQVNIQESVLEDLLKYLAEEESTLRSETGYGAGVLDEADMASSERTELPEDIFCNKDLVVRESVPLDEEEHRYEDDKIRSSAPMMSPLSPKKSPFARKSMRSLEEMLDEVEDTFQESLLKIIDSRGLNDADIYKRADIDRRHFSKIRSNTDYRPKKQTALALALALNLNMDETIDLIGRAGYTLSHSSRADLIVQYCIEHEIYDLTEVNALLYHFDQPLLGGRLA